MKKAPDRESITPDGESKKENWIPRQSLFSKHNRQIG
jgi:hypothetical protein